MKLELYKSSSSFNTINKELTLLTTLNIHLKQNANLLYTQIIIHNSEQLKELNYAKMLDRYYFVQVQTLNNNKFLLLTLDEDVLETYKKEILASSQDVIEKSSAGNIKQKNVSSETPITKPTGMFHVKQYYFVYSWHARMYARMFSHGTSGSTIWVGHTNNPPLAPAISRLRNTTSRTSCGEPKGMVDCVPSVP